MAMGIVIIGTFMVVLDTTVVNVALPQVGIDLGRDDDIDWVVTAYMLAMAAVQPTTGWLADRLGKRTVFLGALGFFTVVSFAVAVSPSFWTMVGFRAVQGAAGGTMIPIGLAIIYEAFPAGRRGTAVGLWGVAAMAAPSFGPVLGGYLVTAADWRWIFLLNVPIGLVGLPLGLRVLRDVGFRSQRRFDGLGAITLTVGLALVLFGVTQAREWGWGSPGFAAVVAAGTLLVAAYVRRASRMTDPLVDMGMFRVPAFATLLLVLGLLTVGRFGVLVFIPLEFQTVRDMSALAVGLMLAPYALAASAMMTVGGRLVDRVGARGPVLVGLGVLAVASWLLGHVETDTGVVVVVGYLALAGAGHALATLPVTVAVLHVLPARLLAQGSAMRMLVRQASGAFGTAVLASVVASRLGAVSAVGVDPEQAQGAYNLVFLIGFWVTVLLVVVAFRLPGRREIRDLHAERAAEAGETLAL